MVITKKGCNASQLSFSAQVVSKFAAISFDMKKIADWQISVKEYNATVKAVTLPARQRQLAWWAELIYCA